MSEALSASLENYLEAIFLAVREKGAARAKDIAGHLGVSSSSVTGALHALSERGLINYAPYELITLTPEGERLARGVVRRHGALKDFLVKVLAVEESEAEATACAMEHSLSRSVLERLIHFMDFIESCPRSGADWIEHFTRFCESGTMPEDSQASTDRSIEEAKKRSGGTGAPPPGTKGC